MSKPENKVRLQAFLQKSLNQASRSIDVSCCVNGSAIDVKSGAPMPEDEISHAEADTAIFTIYHILRGQGYSGAVILDTEDTDNYVQTAYSM